MGEESQSYNGARKAPPVIDAWDALEPEASAPCLFANGFTVVEKYPQAPQYPHLVLASGMESNDSPHFGIGLYLTPHASRHVLRHPSEEHDVGHLVDVLAHHIASARLTSDILKVNVDSPLPIYVVDPAWRPVAERFVAEYGISLSVAGDVYSK